MWYKSLFKGVVLCLVLAISAMAQFGGWGNNGNRGGGNADNNRTPGMNGTGNTVIRFMPYWSNTSAVMIIDGKETTMTAVEDYCGWFQAKAEKKPSGFYIRFKQTIGNIYVGATGAEDVATGALPITEEILLDSIAALSDTLWIRGYENDVPEQFASYPNILGDCPIRTISVMMFDWLHGDLGDGATKSNVKRSRNPLDSSEYVYDTTVTYGNGAKDIYYNNPIYAISNDFGSGGCFASPMKGMVEPTLGANGVPVRAANFPANCKITDHLDYWFLPLTIGQDAIGKTYTNATCRDLELKLDNEGYWLGQKNSSSPEKGLFFLDDFEYLDEAKTVKNIFFDQLDGSRGVGIHNYGFTMKFQAKFVYVPGQKFEFTGDDDVWVYINNRLVVDIGGQHAEVNGSVDLDTLGLTPGETYPFHIFYVERHTGSSNFKMRTSMDLHTDASMFLTNDVMDQIAAGRLGYANYNVWSINKKDALNCNFDLDATEIDTTGGHSIYKLIGNGLDEAGMELLPGNSYFSGIHITSDTTFTIDSVAIVDAGELPPGHYFLQVNLKAKPGQMERVEIIVPGNAPPIAYASENWKVLGTEVSGNVETIGKWAFERYPVNVTFKDKSAIWSKYNKTVKISTDNSLVTIVDKDGNPISSVALDSATKQATFYVMANGNVSNATLTCTGTGGVRAIWSNLNFVEPPVPHVKTAIIYDRNGDGRGDLIEFTFDKAFDGQTKLDSLQVYFGEEFPVERHLSPNGNTLTLAVPGSCTQDVSCGFGTKIFTGGNSEVYTGSATTYIAYTENGKTYHFTIRNEPITDGIGPVIIRAKKTIDGTKHILEISLSEAVTREYDDKMFIFSSEGIIKLPTSRDYAVSNNKITLVYVSQGLDYTPSVSDLIRLSSSKESNIVAKDLLGNTPHEWNPWVPITGDQATTVTSPGVIGLDEENPIVQSDSATQPMLADSNKTAKQIANELGVQGNLIGFTLASMVTNKTTEEIATLETLIARYMSDSVVTVNEIPREEAAAQLFIDIKNNQLGGSNISENTVASIMAGEITVSNYKNAGLSAEDIAAIDELIQTVVEESRDTIVTHPFPSEQSVLDSIASGNIGANELANYGIGTTVLQAIRSGDLNANTIDSYARGLTSVINPDDIVLNYKTKYYSHLGHFINSDGGSVKCSDEGVYGPGKNCLNNSGNIFLAWNMRSKDGKLVGTGVYISRLEYQITVGGEIIKESTRDFLMGVRRGKAVKHEIDTSF
ncbi:MAG: fibro-slime domain-containing protein [Fibrobacter sp.]|nr:fibro-slime domain-containing protein [Fibrobacter sp.]